MIISITVDRAVVDGAGQWVANAARTCGRRAEPVARETWETLKDGLLAAGRESCEVFIDEAETAGKQAVTTLAATSKEAIFATPPDQAPGVSRRLARSPKRETLPEGRHRQ